MGILFPYLGEFQPTKHREKILCWLELFWTVGIIALPGKYLIWCFTWNLQVSTLGVAWIIIPLEIEFVSSYFVFRSWNLFVALCSIPSLVMGVWLCTFPESPKYLIEGGMFDEALTVFRRMYAENTGNPPEDYPVCLLFTLPEFFNINFSGQMLERKSPQCFSRIGSIDNKREKHQDYQIS